MAYTLEQLSADIRTALKADPSPQGKPAVLAAVSRALLDKDFIAQHLTADQCKPRKVLYEDPELGFCVCGHVYTGPAAGAPHDHGPAWAIYGLAEGDTVMTDWDVVSGARGQEPIVVKPARSYTLRPGDAHYYDTGVIHSPNRAGATKLIRIEGANLDHVRRSDVRAA